MDVVKTNIEKIGGTVDVQTKPGQGTTLRIKIPLTLAIIPALIVTSGGERFAIPQVSLLELVRLEGDDARTGIERVGGAPVYRLRGNLLSLVYLDRELKLKPDLGTENRDGDSFPSPDVVNIVVLQADDRHFGLVVDEINDTEEIVVKPLGKQLKGVTAFAGATIMGDGKVALILDVMGLAQQANVAAEGKGAAGQAATAAASSGRQEAADVQTLLLYATGDDGRMAVPLSKVARLEEFDRKSVERAGDRQVVQYRGKIMRLVEVADVPPGAGADARRADAIAAADSIQVVVYTAAGQNVGLVVGRILDICSQAVTVQTEDARPGVLGTAVIQERVTELLDVDGMLTRVVVAGAAGAPVAPGPRAQAA
jgi:two-component system chemotaxis sensor kinase CheA